MMLSDPLVKFVFVFWKKKKIIIRKKKYTKDGKIDTKSMFMRSKTNGKREKKSRRREIFILLPYTTYTI